MTFDSNEMKTRSGWWVPIWKEAVVGDLKGLSKFSSVQAEQNHEKLNQDTLNRGRDSKQVLLEYKSKSVDAVTNC